VHSGADRAGRRARRASRAAIIRVAAACLAAGWVLAACSSPGGPARGSTSAQAGRDRNVAAGPGRQLFVVGGPGGGGFVAVPASGGSGGRPRITVPPIPSTSSLSLVNLPLNTYSNVSVLQQTVLAEASTLLTQKCMAARGFVYATQATASQEQALVRDTEYGFGVSSAVTASSNGYGQPKTAGTPQQGPAFLGGFASFGDLAKRPRAWIVALLGFAPGARLGSSVPAGCLSVASGELYGTDGSGLADPVPSIALQASNWTRSDPRVVAVDAAWSRCMAQRGYTYRTPQQAADARWPSPPTTAETATALADVACKQQVNLPSTWLTVEAAYQAALISQDAPTLAHLQARFSAILKQAEALLSSSGLPARDQLPQGSGRTRVPVVIIG
jgi:hypothetical protein